MDEERTSIHAYFSCEISDVYIHRVFYRWRGRFWQHGLVFCLVGRNLHLQIYMEASGVHFPTYTIWWLYSNKCSLCGQSISLSDLFASSTTEGCDPGTYQAATDTCLPCPANSNSTHPGLLVCPCFEGYYRAAGKPPEMECTRKSFVVVLSITKYSIDYEWIFARLVLHACSGEFAFTKP